MKKKLKGLVSILLCMVLVISSSAYVFATKHDNGSNANKSLNSAFNSKGFKDVKENHWAYKYIIWMQEKGIIDGVGNNMFNPGGTVTRAQFAKMMVNTLNLQLYSPKTPTFSDVKKGSWEYQYVESAKNYLTYYKQSNTFKPSENAVREDMAVALVKALGYDDKKADLSLLDRFADANSISAALRKYVALSVEYGLITGKTENGKLVFAPQGNLTRAEAAALLYRAFRVKEDKVPYEDDKVPYDDGGETAIYVKPSVSVAMENNTVVVRWNKIASPKLKGYRVVISKKDSTPSYPENGYLYYITDTNKNYALINNSAAYNNGDFGKYLTKGEKYYFSVTAVYEDRNVAGNAVRFEYNGAENPEAYVAPVVTASEENGKLVLRWNRINSPKFKNYRVVASKNDSTPSYPENGYLFSISDRNKNYAVIDNKTAYTDGDFGGYFVKGEKYYFNITAVYDDAVIAGNTIQVQYNGEDSPVLFPAPKVSAAYEGGKLLVKWDKIDSERLKEYRVVISQNNQSPAWPANGFYDTAYGKDVTSVEIDGSKTYNDGDFTSLTYGTEYYISVTAVYDNDKTVAGNAVKVLYLISTEETQE